MEIPRAGTASSVPSGDTGSNNAYDDFCAHIDAGMESQRSMISDVRRIVGRLKLRHIELLRALGEDPNVHHVASMLAMSQPTASKLLREIEQIVGTPLFVRLRRGLEPTAVGAVLTRRAALTLAEIGAARDEMVAVAAGASGRLRLGVFPVAVPVLLPEVGARLRALRPGLALQVRVGLEDVLLPDLEAGEVDCVIGRVVPEMLTAAIRHEVLYREPTVVVCSASHPIVRTRGRRRLELLASSDWVLPSRSGALYNMVASWLASEGLPAPRVSYEATSVFAIIELLASAPLLSAVSEGVARSSAATGRLAVLQVELPAANYPVGLMCRSDRRDSADVQQVLTALRAVVDTDLATGRARGASKKPRSRS